MLSVKKSRRVVEALLATFLDQKVADSTTIHPSYTRLVSHVRATAMAGGKRIRPHLIFLAYGDYSEQITKVAAAHELLHMALLVHDDIIDRDNTRHNQPTIHAAYDQHYEPYLPDTAERKHFSQSAALLAGDLLISFAYELMSQAKLSTTEQRHATSLMSRAIFEVAGGELLDTEAPFITEEFEPETVYRYKTASYSFIAPLMTGAYLSPRKLDESSLRGLEEYATNLGIAYQIRDDILGVFGDEEKTGKSATGDLREGKQTFLTHHFKQVMTTDQQALFDQTFGNVDANESSFDTLRTAMQAAGSLEATNSLNAHYTKKALAGLTSISHPALREDLLEFATTLLKRDK